MLITDKKQSDIKEKEIVTVKCDLCKEENNIQYRSAKASFEAHNIHKCKSCASKENGLKRKGTKRSKETIEKMTFAKKKTHEKKYPKVTITCECCSEEFQVNYSKRHRRYCSRSCQSRSIKRPKSVKSTSKCVICKKIFNHYGQRILCSKKCTSEYMSITRIGENNPNSKNPNVKECLNCKKEFEYTNSGMHKDQTRVFCSLKCSHSIDLKNQPLSNRKKQYPKDFNEKFKNEIRKRDNEKCVLCGCKQKSKKHHIHHINYVKSDLDEQNLITLCEACHNATHHGRTFWEIIFSGLISGSKIVRKDWGCEIHIVNHEDYCLKYLVFFKHKQFSHHVHKCKKELWHCVYGKFECVLEKNNKKEYLKFKQGDKIEIYPGVIHQLQAIQNSILVEVSTKDYPEDSIRVITKIN